MKYRTTAKTIRNASDPKLALCYCSAQYLLRNHQPTAYTCGVYGWNFDVYEVDGVTICMGYRGMVGRTPDWALLSSYEHQARSIWEDSGYSYEDRAAAVEELLREWLAKAAA